MNKQQQGQSQQQQQQQGLMNNIGNSTYYNNNSSNITNYMNSNNNNNSSHFNPNNIRRQSDNALKKTKDKNQLSIKQTKLNNLVISNNSNSFISNNNNNSNQNNLLMNSGIITNCNNQIIPDFNLQNRKVRANSCVSSSKGSQLINGSMINQNGIDSKREKNKKDYKYALELYYLIRTHIDINILNEFDTFQDVQDSSQIINDYNTKDLISNIKQLIEIHFIQSKAAELEIKEKHEQECDSYDKNLQRLEAQIRDHIRELKLYLESSQIKCQEQEEQIKQAEKRHAQQTDFLEKVCEQMQQQLEIKNTTIHEVSQQVSQLQQEIQLLKESLIAKNNEQLERNKLQQDFQNYCKQTNNLTNIRSQTENSSQRKIKVITSNHKQIETLNNQVQGDLSIIEDKENNMNSMNSIQVSQYRSNLKQSMRDDVSPEKKIQIIINQQKLQNSQQQIEQKQQKQNLNNQSNHINQFYDKKQVIKNQQDKIISNKVENNFIKQNINSNNYNNSKEKGKELICFKDNYSSSSIQVQSSQSSQSAKRQFSAIQMQTQNNNQNNINNNNSSISSNNYNSNNTKSNGHVISEPEQKYYATNPSQQMQQNNKKSSTQPEPLNSFQERMLQASKKIKEYIKQQSARDKNSSQNNNNSNNQNNNINNKQQCLINKLKYFSMKNSRAPSITNQNNLIQYFYEKFEDKLERNPSERSNIKQKMKTLQQISDRRYSTINHKTEESEGERRVISSKKNQRHNRSNSFNIGSQQLPCNSNSNNNNQTENKDIQQEIKYAKKQKSYLPINSTQSSRNNTSNSAIAMNNLNQIGNLNTNCSNISNIQNNNSFANWNKRRESTFNQSALNNISFQLEGAQKIIMNNNYIDESSDSFENFIKDNFILTNNSTENLKTLEL